MNTRKLTGEASILAAAICVAAAMPSFAQTESASRQLTSDETYAETLTVDSGVTLDLRSNTLPWSTTASQDSRVCSFANDATAIYVKLGDHTV